MTGSPFLETAKARRRVKAAVYAWPLNRNFPGSGGESRKSLKLFFRYNGAGLGRFHRSQETTVFSGFHGPQRIP